MPKKDSPEDSDDASMEYLHTSHTFESASRYWFAVPRDPPLIILSDSLDSNKLLFDGQVNTHDDFLALYVVQHGRGTHIINGVPFSMARGDTYIMGVGAVHQYLRCDGIELDALYFPISFFDEDTLRILRRHPVLNSFLRPDSRGSSGRWKHLSPVDFEQIDQELSELKREWASATEFGKLLTRALFLRFLIHLAWLEDAFDHIDDLENASRAPASTSESISLAIHLIESQFTDPLRIEDVADAVCMSPDWFTRAFASVTGQTPRDYLRHLRVERAKALLMTTRSSVTEIALQSGFGDPAYFARVFRQHTKMTPREFRATARK